MKEMIEKIIRGNLGIFVVPKRIESLSKELQSLISSEAEREAMRFAEWIEKNMYCLSNDSRFPQTKGRWYNKPHPDIPREQTFTTAELYQLFKQSTANTETT